MSAIKQKTQEALSKAKTQAKRQAEAPTYRTILVAASVGPVYEPTDPLRPVSAV